MSADPQLTDLGAGDDAAVIQRSLSDPEAFTTVFDRHAPVIHRYVARRIGAHAADDVVGETFLAAFRRRERYDRSRSNALPWLYGIASNLIGKHRRDEVRAYRALARSGVDPVVESGTERVEARVVAQDLERELAGGLAVLQQRDRDVLLLVAWSELSYDEVADALGIPIGTVRSRLSRARRKLREVLGGTDPRTIAEEPSHG